jgi:hypothetical protein
MKNRSKLYTAFFLAIILVLTSQTLLKKQNVDSKQKHTKSSAKKQKIDLNKFNPTMQELIKEFIKNPSQPEQP